MCDEFFFAGDHLLCIPANLIIPTYTNAPFLLILPEKGHVHNLFTHAFFVFPSCGMNPDLSLCQAAALPQQGQQRKGGQVRRQPPLLQYGA